jgi:hypothetical protein
MHPRPFSKPPLACVPAAGSACIEPGIAMNNRLATFIGISLLVLAISFGIYLNIIRPAQSVANRVIDAPGAVADRVIGLGKHGMDRAADAFTAIFQSKVSIVTSATLCDATPIAELAVLRRNVREFIDYSRTDWGSTKRIIAEQTFVAKIGFDLSAKFSAAYDPSNNVVTITLPEPKVLSLEPSNAAPKYYLDESGYINKLTTADHQQILIQLKSHAARSAEATLAVGDAKQMMETRFRDLFSAFDVKVVVKFPADRKKLTITTPDLEK